MHTEEEAKTKSCCGPMQAEYGKTHVVNCIGSACMAWRWGDDLRRRFHVATDVTAEIERDRSPTTPASWTWVPFSEDGDPAGWLEPEAEAQTRCRGFCGLAGEHRT